MVMFGKKSQDPAGAQRQPATATPLAPASNAGGTAALGQDKAASNPINKGMEPVKPDTTTPKRNSPVGTVIGDDTTIDGKIHSKGTLRVDGCVKGEVKADDSVIIGPTGEVEATVEAKLVTISGKVQGNITATERLELQPTCEILGDIETAEGALVIESGARIEGRCTMGLSSKAAKGPVPMESPKSKLGHQDVG